MVYLCFKRWILEGSKNRRNRNRWRGYCSDLGEKRCLHAFEEYEWKRSNYKLSMPICEIKQKRQIAWSHYMVVVYQDITEKLEPSDTGDFCFLLILFAASQIPFSVLTDTSHPFSPFSFWFYHKTQILLAPFSLVTASPKTQRYLSLLSQWRLSRVPSKVAGCGSSQFASPGLESCPRWAVPAGSLATVTGLWRQLGILCPSVRVLCLLPTSANFSVFTRGISIKSCGFPHSNIVQAAMRWTLNHV